MFWWDNLTGAIQLLIGIQLLVQMPSPNRTGNRLWPSADFVWSGRHYDFVQPPQYGAHTFGLWHRKRKRLDTTTPLQRQRLRRQAPPHTPTRGVGSGGPTRLPGCRPEHPPSSRRASGTLTSGARVFACHWHGLDECFNMVIKGLERLDNFDVDSMCFEKKNIKEPPSFALDILSTLSRIHTHQKPKINTLKIEFVQISIGCFIPLGVKNNRA